ncbi:MAG: peptide chain release factor N(5)-glutamine methyltransferase [Saprospiraceae bacterium]|nr:peptide chain release factor N(5)-glutamine methyltransferase [Saprospiraceae bacterium]
MTPSLVRSLLIQELAPRYGLSEAAGIARIVLEDVFQVHRKPESVFAAEWSAAQSDDLQQIIRRLVAGEPVQYFVGSADFFGLVFQVSPAVLIPRQETEELVAWMLEYLRSIDKESPVSLLDIGLGSGCIGITLKKKIPGIELYGLEKSAEALAVATTNAQRILGDNRPFQFFHGDILEPSDWQAFPLLDIIVSNPPYIPTAEKELMPEHVLSHEPELALFVSNEDPLVFYRTIADFALKKLRPGGVLFFECNEFNAKEVARLLSEKGFQDVALKKDLSGADRMVRGRRRVNGNADDADLAD